METYRGVAYPWEADHMGHMNVQFYMAKFDSATWHFFGAIGMTADWLRENQRGMAAVEQKINYRAELFPGDLIVVQTAVTDVSKRSLRFSHVMSNSSNGEDAATAELVAVHIDLPSRAPTAIPEPIRKRAQEMLAIAGDAP